MYYKWNTHEVYQWKRRRRVCCLLSSLLSILLFVLFLVFEFNGVKQVMKELVVAKPVFHEVPPSLEPSKIQEESVHTVVAAGSIFEPRIITTPDLQPPYIQRYEYNYPPFLLSPPIIVPSQLLSLPELSPVYKSWMEKKVFCDEEICKYPERYADDYREWTCQHNLRKENYQLIVNMCDDVSKGIPIYEHEYVHGVVDFIEDGILDDSYDCGWKSNHHQAVLNQQDNDLSFYYVNATVVFLLIPDGYSFQHFLDGVMPKIVQIQTLLPDKKVKYVIHLKKRFPIVRELFHRIGITDDQMIMKETFMPFSGRIKAKRLVIPCNTPPLHPYLWQRTQYLLKLPWLQPNFHVNRKIVVYLTRNTGSYNGGRRILNEDELLQAIRPVVELKGCELVTFIAKEYKELQSLFDFFSNSVAIFGPHGGALMNMLFLPRNSIVVEMMPNKPEFTEVGKDVHLIMYKQSQLLGHRYFAVFGESDKNDNMIIPPSIISSIFRNYL